MRYDHARRPLLGDAPRCLCHGLQHMTHDGRTDAAVAMPLEDRDADCSVIRRGSRDAEPDDAVPFDSDHGTRGVELGKRCTAEPFVPDSINVPRRRVTDVYGPSRNAQVFRFLSRTGGHIPHPLDAYRTRPGTPKSSGPRRRRGGTAVWSRRPLVSLRLPRSVGMGPASPAGISVARAGPFSIFKYTFYHRGRRPQAAVAAAHCVLLSQASSESSRGFRARRAGMSAW